MSYLDYKINPRNYNHKSSDLAGFIFMAIALVSFLIALSEFILWAQNDYVINLGVESFWHIALFVISFRFFHISSSAAMLSLENAPVNLEKEGD